MDARERVDESQRALEAQWLLQGFVEVCGESLQTFVEGRIAALRLEIGLVVRSDNTVSSWTYDQLTDAI